MKLIRYIKLIFLMIVMTVLYMSCEDFGVSSLEKPESTDVTIDTMFSTAEYAERVVFYAYQSLRMDIIKNGENLSISKGVIEDITDLSHNFMTWTGVVEFYYPGNINSSNAGPGSVLLPYEDDPNTGVWTFKAIRNCEAFLANVHKVPDMSATDKARLSAEARTIIAYNMMELFRNYGGIPWINKVYAADDDFTNPRLTVEATVDSIVSLLDRAIPDLPWVISEAEESNWAGRFTQAGAMALKTRLLLFAASPLFNSDQPYLTGEASTKLYTWYGDYQASRYQRAADAAKDLIDKIDASGGYALEEAATPDVDGYREAFLKGYFTRSSSEILISARDGWKGPARWGSQMYDTHNNYGAGTGSDEYMRMFPMADGTPITDPASGWDESVDPLGCEGTGAERAYSRDPRLYETLCCTDDDWGGQIVQTWVNDDQGWGQHIKGPRRTNGAGSMLSRKFIMGFGGNAAGLTQHQWPLMRLPEIYLSYAEAMNELGNMPEAYTYINKVRNRVGLKNIEDVGTWDKKSLREQILTERACEFGYEAVRWFDITRHKLASALSNHMHSVYINKEADGSYTYTYPEVTTNQRAWWSSFDNKWFLLPFPLAEINKDYGLIQNPGW
jgi:starch-binding outer membrane protein, SusD/RagB family